MNAGDMPSFLNAVLARLHADENECGHRGLGLAGRLPNDRQLGGGARLGGAARRRGAALRGIVDLLYIAHMLV